jgi:hypothetical protein
VRSTLVPVFVGSWVGLVMQKNLKRYYGRGDLHFVTFSCYRRIALLGTRGKTEVKGPTCKAARGAPKCVSITNAGGIPRINSERRTSLESQSRAKPAPLNPKGAAPGEFDCRILSDV